MRPNERCREEKGHSAGTKNTPRPDADAMFRSEDADGTAADRTRQ
jgi:hypothetical protein